MKKAIKKKAFIKILLGDSAIQKINRGLPVTIEFPDFTIRVMGYNKKTKKELKKMFKGAKITGVCRKK